MKTKHLIAAFAIALTMSSCFTSEHVVGTGGSQGNSSEKKQWYVLFGLVPINKVDSKSMAGGATNYTIKVERSFIDGLIGIFTSFVSVYPQTVTVTK